MLRGAKRPGENRSHILLVDLNLPNDDGSQTRQDAARGRENLRHSIVFVADASKRRQDRWPPTTSNVAGLYPQGTAAQDFAEPSDLVDSYWRIGGNA